jgi:hypothetical protein
MTTVRFGHVRGLTPASSVTDMATGGAGRGSAGTMQPAVRNGHVRGLTPDMARGDA